MTVIDDAIQIEGPARVELIPSRFRHTVHAYAAVPAFDASDQRVLYLGFDDMDHGAIVVQDLASGEERVLGEAAGFDFHTAAGQRWVLHDSAILYRRGSEELPKTFIVPADGSALPRALDLAPEFSVRHVCEDSIHATGTARMGRGEGELTIVMADLDAGTLKPLVTAGAAAAALPRELVPSDVIRYSFTHPVANPQIDRLFFKLMRTLSNGQTGFCALFTFHLPTRRLVCLGNRVSGHPVWMPDGRLILNVKSPRDGSDNRWLILQDPDGPGDGEVSRVIDLPIEGPGHPMPTRDGRWIATDAFTADGKASPIYVIDAPNRTVREIARLPHHFVGGATYDPNRITRGQPHPIWTHAGDRLLLNCNGGGTRMRLLLLSEIR